MIRLSRRAFISSCFVDSLGSGWGPFFSDLATSSLRSSGTAGHRLSAVTSNPQPIVDGRQLRLLRPLSNDVLVRCLVTAGLGAERRLTPRAHRRLATDRRLAFAAAV